MTVIEQKRNDWVENVLASGMLSFGRCDKCGSVRHGMDSVSDLSFTCVVCRAEELFPDPPKLDVDDFAKV
jgi:uncharacterized OB-fold protein